MVSTTTPLPTPPPPPHTGERGNRGKHRSQSCRKVGVQFLQMTAFCIAFYESYLSTRPEKRQLQPMQNSKKARDWAAFPVAPSVSLLYAEPISVPEPHVFGPPGSISQKYSVRIRIPLSSFYHQAKIVRKTLIPTALCLLLGWYVVEWVVKRPYKMAY